MFVFSLVFAVMWVGKAIHGTIYFAKQWKGIKIIQYSLQTSPSLRGR